MADEDKLQWNSIQGTSAESPVEVKADGTFAINQQQFALDDPISKVQVNDYIVSKERGADKPIYIYTRSKRLVLGYRFEAGVWQVGQLPDAKQPPQTTAAPAATDNNTRKTLPYKSASSLGVIVLGVVTIAGIFLILLFHPAKRTEQKSSDTTSTQPGVAASDQSKRGVLPPVHLPVDVAAKLKEARSLYEKNDYDRAQKAAEAVLESDDKNTEANEILAGCLIVSEKYQEAVDHLNTALDGRPNAPQLRLMRGNCYAEMKITEKARGDFLYIIDRTTPSNPVQREQAQWYLDNLDANPGG